MAEFGAQLVADGVGDRPWAWRLHGRARGQTVGVRRQRHGGGYPAGPCHVSWKGGVLIGSMLARSSISTRPHRPVNS